MNTRLLFFLLIATCGILLLSNGANAQTRKCSQIDGSYQRSDKLVMTINQQDCNFTGGIPSPGYDHTIKGSWESNKKGFSILITRVSRSGCLVNLKGRLFKNGNKVRTDLVIANPGESTCDLKPDFHEIAVWFKRS